MIQQALSLDTTDKRVVSSEYFIPGWIGYLMNNGMTPIADLDSVICEVFGLDQGDLFARNRKKRIVLARFAYFYIMNLQFRYSTKALERITGWTHPAIFNGVKKARRFLKHEYWFIEKMDDLKEIIYSTMIRVPMDPLDGKDQYNLVYKGKQLINSTKL